MIRAEFAEFTALRAQQIQGAALRRLFTTEEALAGGVTMGALRWGERRRRWRRVRRGVYAVGPEPPSQLDRVLARVVATGGVADGNLAGVLHGLDGVRLDDRPTRRRCLSPERVIRVFGIPCTDGLQTMIDLAASLDDAGWEQALEAALRGRLVTLAQLEACLPELGRARAAGTSRIRRMLALRPVGAPPTESLLETLMVQLVRAVPDLPDPVRQVEIWQEGSLVARVDLAWPALGLFVELDGQHHRDQPVHDARRETAVVAATGWLCGRFTWTEVVRVPAATRRRLASLAEQARRRPPQTAGQGFVHPWSASK